MIPELTHLQFLVLSILMDAELSGRQVRAELAKHGVDKSLAAFYQLMSRLEEAKMIAGRYESKLVEGVAIKERHYSILLGGVAALKQAYRFYAEALAHTSAKVRFV